MPAFSTTIYSDDDRYRGLADLRTVVFMNADDMRDRGLGERAGGRSPRGSRSR